MSDSARISDLERQVDSLKEMISAVQSLWAGQLGALQVQVRGVAAVANDPIAPKILPDIDPTPPDESFDLLSQSGGDRDAVTISKGYIDYHLVNDYTIAETPITLTGGPVAWVFVWASWNDFTSNGVDVGYGTTDSDRPRSDGSKFKKVLWEFSLVTATRWGDGTDRRPDVDVLAAMGH